ncbi:MAG: endolytic transglycosylase MltG [Pseudomonadota bacterium]
MSRLAFLPTLLLAAVLAGLIAAFGFADGLLSFARTPLAHAQPVCFEVERGASLTGVIRQFKDELVLGEGDPPRLRLLARLSGSAGRLRAGEYRVEPGQTPAGLLRQLAEGKVVLHRVTLVPGMTLEQARDVLAHHPAVRAEGFALRPVELMAAIGQPGKVAEGHFLPETYAFPRGTSDIEILRMANDSLLRELDRLWSERQADLPLKDPAEAVILASVIEKETGKAEERPLIAGVFVNRLRKGMRLQTDPTVIYGLGPSFDGNLRRRDLETDTPWNTYTRAGLPPTPIALPSRAALRAALHPEATRALYFVADGTGGHTFSETLDAHNRAVNKAVRNGLGSPPGDTRRAESKDGFRNRNISGGQ